MAFTRERTIEIALTRWSRGGYCPNLTLRPDPHHDFLLSDEQCLARIDASSGERMFITSRRLVWDATNGRVAIPYEDVKDVHWITTQSSASLSTADAQALKRKYFDRLIVERHEGPDLVIDRLGQAVIPLLQVIHFVLRHRRTRRNSFPWYTWPFANYRRARWESGAAQTSR